MATDRLGKPVRRHRETGWIGKHENHSWWVFSTSAKRSGVELRGHVCSYTNKSLWLAIEANLSPDDARELAKGLIDAADFFDSQTARINAKEAAIHEAHNG